MKDKLLKLSTISATFVLILAIIITSLVFAPGMGDGFAKPNVNKVAGSSDSYVTSASSDGIVRHIDLNTEFHEDIDSEASLLKYLRNDGSYKSIGLLTKNITITNDSLVNKVLSKGKTLNGNGYTITVEQNSSMSDIADHSIVNEFSDKELGYNYSYYGGIVGANYGTIENLTVDYQGTSVINQDISDVPLQNENHADGFAAGVVAGINFGVIRNVSATVSKSMGFSATNVDVFAGVLAGVNYGSITRATSVLNNNMTSQVAKTNKLNVLSAGVGLMINHLELVTSKMGEITIQGSEKANLELSGNVVTEKAYIGVVYGLNSKHCIESYTKLASVYKAGEINGVIFDYNGEVKSYNSVISNLPAGSCGAAGNIYYTSSTIDVRASVVKCTDSTVFPNQVDVAFDASGANTTPEVELSFSSGSNSASDIIRIDVKAGIADKTTNAVIIYDIVEELRTVKIDSVNVLEDGSKNKTIVKYNHDDKVLTRHASMNYIENGALHTAHVFKQFKTLTVNYGTLGSVGVETHSDNAYDGGIKADIELKDAKGLVYDVGDTTDSIGVYGIIQGASNYNLFNTPGIYDHIKTEMNNTYSPDGALTSDNSGVTYVDIAKKIIFPLTVFDYTGVSSDGSNNPEAYTIANAAASIDLLGRDGKAVEASIANPQNKYTVNFNILGGGMITSVHYITSNGEKGEVILDNPSTIASIVFDKGDFGKDGKKVTFIGYNGSKVVTLPTSTMLYLDAVAPELNIDFDNMTEFSPSSQIIIRGTAFDANDSSLEVKFTDGDNSPISVNVGADRKFNFIVRDSGERDVTISVTDSAGNTFAEDIHLMIDNVKPIFDFKVTSIDKDYPDSNAHHLEFSIKINSGHISGIDVYVQLDNEEPILLVIDNNGYYKFVLKETPAEGTVVKITTINGAMAETPIYLETIIISSTEKILTVSDLVIPQYISKSYDGTNALSTGIVIRLRSNAGKVSITAVYSDINAGTDIPLILSFDNIANDGVKYDFEGEITGDIDKTKIDIEVGDSTISYGDQISNINTEVKYADTAEVITDNVFNSIVVILADETLDINDLDAGRYDLTVDEESLQFDNYKFDFILDGRLNVEKLEVVVMSDNDGFYNQSYTGSAIAYNPYYINKDKIEVPLTIDYSYLISQATVESPIDAAEYKGEIRISDAADAANYYLEGSDSNGVVTTKLHIFQFKPEFIIDNISNSNILNVTYKDGESPDYLIYKDGSSTLSEVAVQHYYDNFDITYTEQNGQSTDIAPRNSGTYSVVMDFHGDSDSNFANERKVFTMVVNKLEAKIIFGNINTPFNEKAISPVINNIPSEFGEISVLGEDTDKIVFYTLEEYQAAIDSNLKFDTSILYVILTRVNISQEEIDAGGDNDDLASTFSYITAGEYDFELRIISYNYIFNETQYDATLAIDRVRVSSLVDFANVTVDYDLKAHTINEPTWNMQYVDVKPFGDIPVNNVDARTYKYEYIATSPNLINGTEKFIITLTIKKIDFISSEIEAHGGTKVFDGNPFSIVPVKLPVGAAFESAILNNSLINVGIHEITYTVTKKNYNDEVINLTCTITPVYVDVIFDKHDRFTINDTVVLTGHFIGVKGEKIAVTIDTSKVNALNPGIYTCDVTSADTNYIINDDSLSFEFELHDEVKVGLIVGLLVGSLIGSGLTYLITMILIKKKRQTIYL